MLATTENAAARPFNQSLTETCNHVTKTVQPKRASRHKELVRLAKAKGIYQGYLRPPPHSAPQSLNAWGRVERACRHSLKSGTNTNTKPIAQFPPEPKIPPMCVFMFPPKCN